MGMSRLGKKDVIIDYLNGSVRFNKQRPSAEEPLTMEIGKAVRRARISCRRTLDTVSNVPHTEKSWHDVRYGAGFSGCLKAAASLKGAPRFRRIFDF